MVFWLIWHFAFGILSSDSEFDSSSESDSENDGYMSGMSDPEIVDQNEDPYRSENIFFPQYVCKKWLAIYT